MSIIRIYNYKSSTIASNPDYQSLNSGKNAVFQLFYGGGGGDSSPDKRNNFSRFLLGFDLSNTLDRVNQNEINPELIKSVTLNLVNAFPTQKDLENDYEYDVLYKRIARSYELIAFDLPQVEWSEGLGQDLFRELYIQSNQTNGYSPATGYCNWNYSRQLQPWPSPGVYQNITADTLFYNTQFFDNGNENIKIDIKDSFKNALSSVTFNYGLGVAYSSPFEAISSDTRFLSSFFSENTNTSNKPYIEIEVDDYIKDDRLNICTNKLNKLYLYTFAGNDAVNFYSAGTVSIVNSSNQPVLTGKTITKHSKGVYFIELTPDDLRGINATPGQRYKDVWQGITFDPTPGYDVQNVEQNFQIQKNPYLNNKPSINNYKLTTYGIDNGSIVSNEEMIRIFCDLRVNYSTNSPYTPYEIEYRMIMNNQTLCIDWTKINQVCLDGKCMENYFNLDTSWLLHNQTYKIQFRVKELGTAKIMSEDIVFRVQRSF